MYPYLQYSKINNPHKTQETTTQSIPNTFRLFEKDTGRYLNDTGDREEFHEADNTDQKDGETNAKPQLIRRFQKDNKQTTTGIW